MYVSPSAPPPLFVPIVIAGPTTTNEIAISAGNLAPAKFPRPNVWINDTTPHVNKSNEIKNVNSDGDNPNAFAIKIGTATAPPYITATC